MSWIDRERVKKRIGTSAGSEAISWVVAPLGVWAVQKIPFIDQPLRNMTRTYVEPRIEKIEQFLHQKLPNIAPDMERDEHKNLTRDEKVSLYTDELLEFALYNVGGIIARVYTGKALDKLAGIPDTPMLNYWGARAFDWSTQLVTVGAVNNTFRETGNSARQGLTSVFEKVLPIDTDTADKLSRLSVNIMFPNALGWISSNVAMETFEQLSVRYGKGAKKL